MCTVSVNGIQVSGSVGETKKIARTKATDISLDIMRKWCFTIKVNIKKKCETELFLFIIIYLYMQMMPEKLKTINVETTTKDSLSKLPEVKSLPSEECKLTENNIGFKMMKMLGWTGGALSEGGISEPINVQLKVNRHGLGLSANKNSSTTNDKQFKGQFYAYLRKYISEKDNVYELVFSKDFSKEERAMLHT